MRASPSTHSRLALTLATGLLAVGTDRTTNVTPTVDAPKEVGRVKQIGVGLARITRATLHIVLAHTLATLTVAQTESTHGAILIAKTFLATGCVVHLQIPVEIFALVTDTTFHTFFALAEFSNFHLVTSAKFGHQTCRVAVAFWARKEMQTLNQ